MRTCVHARINAGMTQFFLLARLLLFENPYSPESRLLAKRCMQVYVCVYVYVCVCVYMSPSSFSPEALLLAKRCKQVCVCVCVCVCVIVCVCVSVHVCA